MLFSSMMTSCLKVNATMGSEVLLDIWPAVKKLKVITMFKRAKLLLYKTIIVTKDNNVVYKIYFEASKCTESFEGKVLLSPGTPDHNKSGGERGGSYIESALRDSG